MSPANSLFDHSDLLRFGEANPAHVGLAVASASAHHAVAQAEAEGLHGWLIDRHADSLRAVPDYSDVRAVRRTVYEECHTRASDMGPHAGRFDDRSPAAAARAGRAVRSAGGNVRCGGRRGEEVDRWPPDAAFVTLHRDDDMPFSPIGGGDAAGCYRYLGAERRSADAFEPFAAAGADRLALGATFRDHVLAHGGTRIATDDVVAFRGRTPQADALLRSRALAA